MSRVLGKLLDKAVENMDDYSCAEIRDLVDPKEDKKMWICSNYPFQHKTTVHCAERRAKLLGRWTMQQLKL